MSVQQGGYHQALLHESPVAARAQIKEEYNVDLFDDRPSHSPTQPLSPRPPYDVGLLDDLRSRPLFTQLLSPPLLTDTNVENKSQGRFPPPTFPYPREPAQPFWQTRKGLTIISVIVILVVGGVIGGAVGGTVGKNQVNASPVYSTSSFQSATTTDTTPQITAPPTITTPPPETAIPALDTPFVSTLMPMQTTSGPTSI